MKLGLAEVEGLALLAVGFVLWRGWKTGTLNPADRNNAIYQSTGEIGLTIADTFKSDAEKKVDAMLGPVTVPTVKKTVTPVDLPANFYSGSYYDLGVKPLPVDDSRGIGASGVLTSSAYRDQVR